METPTSVGLAEETANMHDEPEGRPDDSRAAADRLEEQLSPYAVRHSEHVQVRRAFGRVIRIIARVNHDPGSPFPPLDVFDNDADGSALQGALSMISGIPDKWRTQIQFMSCARPFGRPSWMSPTAYETAIRSSYAKTLDERVRPADGADDLGDTLSPFVRAAIRLAFGDGIRPQRLFGPGLPLSVSCTLWENMLTVMACDVSSALRGKHDDQRGRGFAWLSEHLCSVIPLGMPDDAPQRNPWVVAIR